MRWIIRAKAGFWKADEVAWVSSYLAATRYTDDEKQKFMDDAGAVLLESFDASWSRLWADLLT